MPVFNGQAYLAQAIESVLKQTYSDWELIIVNDGSTDASEEIVRSISDSRIKYLYQEKSGVSKARNYGMEHVSGKFVCFLDSDDVLPPDSISCRVTVLEKQKDVGAVDGCVEIYNSTLDQLVRTWAPTVRGNVTRQLARLDGNCFFGITWMIRVVPGQRLYFNEEMTHCEDLLFFVDVSRHTKYDFVNETIYKCRLRGNSAMMDIDALGRGYRAYHRKIFARNNGEVTKADRLILLGRIRKIMFLSYLNRWRIARAFRYLIMGR